MIAEELVDREGEPDPAQQDWRQKLDAAAMTRLHVRLQQYRIMLGHRN